jgi:hypothetical protein
MVSRQPLINQSFVVRRERRLVQFQRAADEKLPQL